MQLKPDDQVVVQGYGGREVKGIVVNLDGETVGITTLAERESAGKAAREPVVIGFPARDVKRIESGAARK